MSLIGRSVQTLLRPLGFELKRVPPGYAFSEAARIALAEQEAFKAACAIDASFALFRWLRASTKISTLIDIGANDGSYLEFLHRQFSPVTSLAFEPIPAARRAIESRELGGVTVFPLALSDHTGSAQFEINAYNPASSMLPVSDLSRREFPQTASATECIEVPVARLDDVVKPDMLTGDIFVKMDVQGVEDKVIAGGSRVLGAAHYMLIEMSFRPLYEGQALFEQVHAPLVALGFRLAGMKNQVSAESGEPLFAHFLYRADRS